MRRLTLALILLSAAGLAARPQLPVGSIDGVVVKLGTNDPISGVNVELRRIEGTAASPLGPLVYPSGGFSVGAVVIPNAPNPGDLFHARTKDDGRFVFTSLKPGKYRLLSAHPLGTYSPAEYGQRNPRGPGYDFTFEEAQSLKIRLEMAPFASVSGRVIDAEGRPAARVRVMAAEVAYQNGERILNLMQAVQTDERGNYRLFWLPPGQYFVGALPEGLRRREFSGAYGPPGQVESLNQTFSQPLITYRTGADGQVLEEVYETVYHPGDTNLQSARSLDLRPGANLAGIDISLAAGRRPAVRIRGLVINGMTGQPAPNATVRAVPRVSAPAMVAPMVTADTNGAFEISGVMRGEYSIVAQLAGNLRQSAVQTVIVGDSAVEGLQVIVNSGRNIPGRITLDNQNSDSYRVGVTPVGRLLLGVTGTAFPLTGAQPGTYRVSVTPGPGADLNVYIRSIAFGGTESPDGRIHIGDSSFGDLEIALGTRGGSVEGRVIDAQGPAPNAMVVLVPIASTRPDLFKNVTTDLRGEFRIVGVAPGSYRLFAWPYIPRGMEQYPEFMRRVEGLGKIVAIAEGSTLSAELTLLPEPMP